MRGRKNAIIILLVLVLVAYVLMVNGQSIREEENLMGKYSKLGVQVEEKRLMVHVKVFNGIIMDSNLLENLAQLMNVGDYKEFQFYSDSNIFTTRLSSKQIHTIAKNEFGKRTIEWIKHVTKQERRGFTQFPLESLKSGSVRVSLDKKLNEMEKLQLMNKVRNWYLLRYNNKLNQFISQVDLNSLQQSQLTKMPLNIQQDTELFKTFITEQTNSLYNLDWNMEGESFQISLSNFDHGVWSLIKKGKFDHPLVLSLKRREEVQEFFHDSESLSHVVNQISEQMGEELFDKLLEEEAVDSIHRLSYYEIKNYGSNQVIQNGGGTDYTYMWNNGITGASEVVSVIDTGLTLGHCFFSATSESTTKTTVNMNNRKVVYYNYVNSNNGDLTDGEGHGTHVAGTIAGYPQTTPGTTSTSDLNVGVAKDAKLYFVDVQKGAGNGLYIGDVSTILKNAFTQAGSKISSNSWGCGNPYECDFDCKCYSIGSGGAKTPKTDADCIKESGRRCCHYCNVYGYDSNKIDSYLNTNDEVTFVVAAGNDGRFSTDSNMGDPGTSKSALTVGASLAPSLYYKKFFKALNYTLYEMENMSDFSGRGPTYDNRIKPDITAPGNGIISALNQANACGVQTMSGTSMATPAVSGGAALLRHYLVKDNNKKLVEYNIFNKDAKQTLSGTLVKAMLIHSADTMKGFVQLGGKDTFFSQFSYPNNYYGYGRINLGNVLKIDSDPNSVSKVKNVHLANRYSLDANQQVDIVFTANSATSIKATLAWYDLPSAAESLATAAKKLINDIDMVILIGSNTYYGNAGVTGNKMDSTNTVESMTVSNIAQGTTITLRIGSKATNKGKQTFSMIVTGDVSLKETPKQPIPIPSTNNPLTPSQSLKAAGSGTTNNASIIEISLLKFILLIAMFFIFQ